MVFVIFNLEMSKDICVIEIDDHTMKNMETDLFPFTSNKTIFKIWV